MKTAAVDDRFRLLHGPYHAPPLKKRERAFCLFRDAVVVVLGWSDAPLPWPRGRRLDPPGGNGRMLVVDDELVRAVRSESGLAVGHWWGVSRGTVQRWRAAFGVGRMDSEGSRRLILANISTVVISRLSPPPGEAADPQRHVLWTAAETALVGALPDDEVARRTGRSLNSVRQKRKLLGRPNPKFPDSSYLPWTPEADALALTLTATEAAARTGHTRRAVFARRVKLRGQSV